MIVDPNHTTQVIQITSNTVLYSSVFTAVNKGATLKSWKNSSSIFQFLIKQNNIQVDIH